MQISISAVKTVNLGDHGERQTTVYEYVPDETVEDLMRRVLHEQFSTYGRAEPSDKVVLKLVIGADGKPSGSAIESQHAPGPDF